MTEEKLTPHYWQDRYDQGTTGWDRGEPSPGIKMFLEQIRELPVRRILVPGCGRGHEVITLAQLGFEVTGIDFAAAAVAAAQLALVEQKLTANILHADLLEYDPPQPFDAIYEQTCLCALHPSQWPSYAAKLAQWLRPDGLLFAMFMQTTQEQGPPFPCRLPQMRVLFPPEKWKWQPVLGRIEHPMGLHEWACLLQRV